MKFEIIDFNKEFDARNVITSSDTVVKGKGMNKFAPNSIFCPVIFGKPFGESIVYQCDTDCTDPTKGKFNEGTLCPACNTIVSKHESLLSKQGWIDFEKYEVINPLMYIFIEKIIGKVKLLNIIGYDKKLDVDGHLVDKELEEDTTNELHELGIYGMGLPAFILNMYEILEHFTTKKTQHIYDFITTNRSKVTISKFPVMTQRLRPGIIIGDEFRYDKINNLYIRVIANNNSLNELLEEEKSEILIDPILFSIQRFLNQIHDTVIDNINGKYGWLRNNLMANRTNFSSRCVVTPLNVNHNIDDVELPYLCALELLKFHIIRLLLPLYNYKYNKALAVWRKATLSFDPEVYEIMKLYIAEVKGGLKILLNRNPTIAFGSILCMNVVGVKTSYSDLTMSLSNNILVLLNADFDGDVLNIFLILDQKQKKFFEKLSPTNMMISNNNGKFNSALGFTKDYQLGMYTLLKGR